mmetsp:Transcript_7081/g.18400  ORF Transcript_7081/g.18400 Transcript_7081/m.18400 type:complete len:259 (+) Transcript_7081:751-1527(+)
MVVHDSLPVRRGDPARHASLHDLLSIPAGREQRGRNDAQAHEGQDDDQQGCEKRHPGREQVRRWADEVRQLVLQSPQRHGRESDQERQVVQQARVGPKPENQVARAHADRRDAQVDEPPPWRAPCDFQQGQVQAEENLGGHVHRPIHRIPVAPVEQRPEAPGGLRPTQLPWAHPQLYHLQLPLQLRQQPHGHGGLQPGQACDAGHENFGEAAAHVDEFGRDPDRVGEHRRDEVRRQLRLHPPADRRGACGPELRIAEV